MTTSLRRPSRHRIASSENRINIMGARKRHAIRAGATVRFATHFVSDLDDRALIEMMGRVVETRGTVFPRLITVDWHDGHGPTRSTEEILALATRHNPNRGSGPDPVRPIGLRREPRTARTRAFPAPNRFYDDVIPTLMQLREGGMSLRAIAARMNAEGRVSSRGKPWDGTLGMRLLEGATGGIGWKPAPEATRA